MTEEIHLCGCGCGKQTDFYRGKPNQYINGHNTRGKITKRFTGRGFKGDYEWRLMPWHPNANGRGRVDLHVLKMTQKIGRPLNKGEVVHHIDGNPKNNNISNLMLLSSQAEHMRIHKLLDKSARFCSTCGSTKTETYRVASKEGLYECWYDDGIGGFKCKNCYRKEKRKNKK